MSFVLCEKKDLVALADKIRESTGSTNGLTFGEIVNNYGGSGGLKNGYDVTFYDENSEELAFYSIRQGNSINPPNYVCKAWKTVDNEVVNFPYTPIEDLVLYANNDTLASQLYNFYNIDQSEYPYLIIVSNFNNHISMYFAKSISSNTTSTLGFNNVRYGYKITADHKNMDKSDLSGIVEFTMNTLTGLSTYKSYNMNSGSGWYHYTNFDSNLDDGTITYRLD